MMLGNKKKLSEGNHEEDETIPTLLYPESSYIIIDPQLLKYVKIAKEMVTDHQIDQ